MKKSSLTQNQIEIILNMYQFEKVGSTTIAKRMNLKNGIVAYYINKFIGLRSCREAARKYSCNDNYFNEINTADKAYWLGFLYADGYISSINNQKKIGIALAEKDRQHLEKFREAISATYPIHSYKVSGGYNINSIYSRIHIVSEKMFDDLLRHGVLEHKSLKLQAPNISQEYEKDFIRGYIDGDGCITTHQPRNGRTVIQYSVKILGTENLLNFIKLFIEKNNCATIKKFYKRHNDDSVCAIDFGGNRQTKKFLDIIYKNANTYLERKYQKYLNLCNLIHSRSLSKDMD